MAKILTVFLILIASIAVSAQDKRIAEIRRIYQQTNELIKKAEKNFKESEIFVTEMITNKAGTPYPAVGIFGDDIKFYYTYGDRLKTPYPYRLLKIETKTYRSAMTTHNEYYFDADEELVFHYSKLLGADDESRLYFDDGKIFRFLVGADDITNSNFRRKEAIVRKTLERQKKLVNIFKNSL